MEARLKAGAFRLFALIAGAGKGAGLAGNHAVGDGVDADFMPALSGELNDIAAYEENDYEYCKRYGIFCLRGASLRF